MHTFVFYATSIFLVSISTVFAESEQTIINNLLTNYHPKERPPGTNRNDRNNKGPVNVTVNIYLRRYSFDDVDHTQMTSLTFRQEWLDERLKFDHKTNNYPFVVMHNASQIWTPDTFFQNEIADDKEESGRVNSLIRVYPDGRVLFSEKLAITFSCPISAQYYPFDSQVCLIEFASYGFTKDDIIYQWKSTDPVQRKAGLEKSLPSWSITDVNTEDCSSITSTGAYSCLKVKIALKRSPSFDTHRVFGYGVILVFASWIPFWLEPIDVTARAVIGSACLASTVFFNHAMMDEKPVEKVAYKTSVGVWTDTIVAFVFLALLQLAIVVLLSPGQFFYKSRSYELHQNLQLIDQTDEPGRKAEVKSKKFSVQNYNWGKRFDFLCRILFPAAFLLFNIIFWSVWGP